MKHEHYVGKDRSMRLAMCPKCGSGATSQRYCGECGKAFCVGCQEGKTATAKEAREARPRTAQ